MRNPYFCTLNRNKFKSMKRKLHFFMLLMATFMPLVAKTQIVTIGDATSSTSHYAAPIDQYFNYSFVEMLVPSAEIAAGHPTTNTIVNLGFYSPTGSNGFDYTFTVYMKNVDINEFGATMVPVSNADIVYTGTLVPQTNAWTTFDLDRAFIYDPTRTLLIAVNKTSGQQAGPSFTWQYTATTTNSVLMAHRDGYSYLPTTVLPSPSSITDWQKTFRPNMQLVFGTPNDCEKPIDLSIGAITGHSAVFSWSSSASAWQICLNDDESHLIDVTSMSYTLQGLAGGTTHTVKVRSKCSNTSYSNWSSTMRFTTPVTCPQPTNLAATLTPGNGTIATLSWTETGDATDWVIEYGTASDFTGAIAVNVSGTPSKVLTNLAAETTCYARVKANCGSQDGESIWSEAIAFTPTNDYFFTVNDPADTTNDIVPIYGTWVDGHISSQFIIPAADLADIQHTTINKLAFYGSVTSLHSHWDNAQFEVYMAETNAPTMLVFTDWNMLEKVMNKAHLEINDGIMVVTLDTPFPYKGGNLLIGFKQTLSGQYSSCSWLGVTAPGASVGGSGFSVSQQNFLPKVTFYYTNEFYPNDFVFVRDGNWGGTANWLGGKVPKGGNVIIRANAIIPARHVAFANEITVEEGGSITINDGGQLKHNTPGLEVTMKKRIPAYTGNMDRYQLLAFPISQEVDVPASMTAAEGNDFYMFDNSMRGEEWRNNKQVAIDSLAAFNGYLYASPQVIDLSMTCPTNPSLGVSLPLTYTDGENQNSGWYLLGNPFTCAAYIYDENNAPMEVMFYDEAGEMTTLMAGPIPPMQGFFVKISADTNVYFLPYRR